MFQSESTLSSSRAHLIGEGKFLALVAHVAGNGLGDGYRSGRSFISVGNLNISGIMGDCVIAISKHIPLF